MKINHFYGHNNEEMPCGEADLAARLGGAAWGCGMIWETYGHTFMFIAGMALACALRPGWIVQVVKNGRFVWIVKRKPCKGCPIVKQDGGGE